MKIENFIKQNIKINAAQNLFALLLRGRTQLK